MMHLREWDKEDQHFPKYMVLLVNPSSSSQAPIQSSQLEQLATKYLTMVHFFYTHAEQVKDLFILGHLPAILFLRDGELISGIDQVVKTAVIEEQITEMMKC